MAREPVSRDFRLGAAALGAAMLGAVAINAANVTPVYAEDAAKASTTAPDDEPISKRECGIIFSTSSAVVGSFHGKLQPVFTRALAKFIADPFTDAATQERIDRVSDFETILVKGNFSEVAHPKTTKELEFARGILKAINCNGPKIIPTPDGEESDAQFGIRRLLISGDPIIDLDKKGVRFVDPAQVASNDVKPSVLPAALRPAVARMPLAQNGAPVPKAR